MLKHSPSGFRPRDSTINQGISIAHSIFIRFDCNPPLDIIPVYLDISKAFDRVLYDGLVYKLRQNGVSGQLLSLIQSFMAARMQRAVLNGRTSQWGTISAGVPQGSILGPLFFLVVNDMTAELKCNARLFADDTSLFSVVHNPNGCAAVLNHDLDAMGRWAHDWRMSLNPDPAKQAVEVLFSK